MEEALAAAGAYYEWTDFGLRGNLFAAAVVRHPVTSGFCWFNQVDQWHRDFESVKLSIGARNDPRLIRRRLARELGQYLWRWRRIERGILPP